MTDDLNIWDVKKYDLLEKKRNTYTLTTILVEKANGELVELNLWSSKVK